MCKVKIDAAGQLSAQISYDNPAAAAEARGRAGDLQQALQQAGFDIGQSGLSFQSGDPNARDLARQDGGSAAAGLYADAVDDVSDQPSALAARTLNAAASGGLDITI